MLEFLRAGRPIVFWFSVAIGVAYGLPTRAQDFPIEPLPPVATAPSRPPVADPPKAGGDQTATTPSKASGAPATKPVAGQSSTTKRPVQPVPPTAAPKAPPVTQPTKPPRPVPSPAEQQSVQTTAPAPTPSAPAVTPLSAIVEAHAAMANGALTESGSADPLIVPNFREALEDVPTELLPLQLLDEWVQPNTRRELRWASSQSFDGVTVTTPVIVFHGNKPGPRLCLTAAIHGDEINGIEIIRRVLNDLRPAELAGTVIAVPIVNYLGYARGSRYLPDRRDLNRFFPGSRSGSAASRIANSFFHDIAKHCHAVVDFHTGSFDRSNLPQVRGDLSIPAVLEFTRGFGATAVLHSPGSRGMLRKAASDIGIPAVTFEVGSPMRLETSEIDVGVQAMHTLLHNMGMTRSFRMWSEPQATFYAAKWVRADTGGMLFTSVKLGDRVREGQRLGKVVDPLANTERAILSPVRGRVLGMALNQIVLPGFAAFHIGVEADEQTMLENAQASDGANSAAEEEEVDESRIEPAQDDEDVER
ncbi:succinylglutamate desuccinylase/aspartoacylase family protein [Ahniella affigens]|nr:succinylglutamate desuccinylase/aspartoacylase family protein [Ahniella affigens]